LVNGKAPLHLTLLAMALLLAGLLLLQPYTADWPGTSYAAPARSYVRAAIRQDSNQLARMSATPAPVLWALAAARAHPDTLGAWAGRVRAFTGEQRGDTVEVFLYPPGEVCEDAPIAFRFVGSGSAARVVRASSSCLDPH
jgi:hypothetical protein